MEDKLTEIDRCIQMLSDLAYGRITPRSVVGTGYKDARKVAFMYLTDRLVELNYKRL